MSNIPSFGSLRALTLPRALPRALALALGLLACTPQTESPAPSPSPSPDPPLASDSTPPATDLEHAKPTPMNDIDFGLGDDDYWNDPKRTDTAIVEALWALGQDSVAIGAPRFVALEAHDSLPLVVYRGASYRELWAMSLREYGQVVAVDLDHNRAFVGPVVADDEAVRKKRLNPADAPQGSGSESHVADLRADLGFAWQPSNWLITVLVRDHASNRVRVELGKQAGAYHDEEVARFLAAERAKPAAPKVSPKPGQPLPSYAAIEASPAIPDAIGIALAGDRVVVSKAGARSVLRGAFRLPVLDHERSDEGSAVVGVTLVVNASDRPESGVIRLDVPATIGADGLATGYFAIDLISEGLAREAQTYFVYAFSGEVMVGPSPAALVAESMISGG